MENFVFTALEDRLNGYFDLEFHDLGLGIGLNTNEQNQSNNMPEEIVSFQQDPFDPYSQIKDDTIFKDIQEQEFNFGFTQNGIVPVEAHPFWQESVVESIRAKKAEEREEKETAAKRKRSKKEEEENFLEELLPNKRKYKSVSKTKQARVELNGLSIVDHQLFLERLVKEHGKSITHSVCYQRLVRLLKNHSDHFWVEGNVDNQQFFLCYQPKSVKEKFREWEGLSLPHYERKLRGFKKDKELALSVIKTTHPNRKIERSDIKMWGFKQDI